MADYSYHVECDAENKTLKIVVRDSTGADVTASGIIELNLAQVMGKHIKARETKGCDSSGNPVYAVVLRSEWYSTAIGSDFT